MNELRRKQVYLTRTELTVLDKESKKTGASESELIRRAVDRTYLGREGLSRAERLRHLQVSGGAWSGRTQTGAEYVETRRAGRLAGLRARATRAK
jgi:hypothetical protein